MDSRLACSAKDKPPVNGVCTRGPVSFTDDLGESGMSSSSLTERKDEETISQQKSARTWNLEKLDDSADIDGLREVLMSFVFLTSDSSRIGRISFPSGIKFFP